jgi:hypothetical protein
MAYFELQKLKNIKLQKEAARKYPSPAKLKSLQQDRRITVSKPAPKTTPPVSKAKPCGTCGKGKASRR